MQDEEFLTDRDDEETSNIPNEGEPDKDQNEGLNEVKSEKMQEEDFQTDQYDASYDTSNIQDEDENEGFYEELSHKIVYRRSAVNRQDFSREEHDEGQVWREEHDTGQDTSTKSRNWKSERVQEDEGEDEFKWSGRDLPDKPSRSWPARSEEYDHKRPQRTRVSDKSNTYYAVAKWEVDYSNKNYIRSKMNKPGGFHRYALGRPLDWDIEYDNMYYLRSFVNAPKGYHRQKQDIKRKRVPDKDPLADSTGWELEYGPEFNQQEGDVPYMPEDRKVARGAYRYHGVRRNNSDCDRKIHEKQLDFKELNKDELKYGPEFLQKDVNHILEQKDRRIGRGGYRHYDADRNIYDERPTDPPDGVEYRESYATLGQRSEESEDEKDIPKGKPFKRTILKKIVKLGKPLSTENIRYSTHLKFIPGEGSRSFYEGQSLRKSGSQAKKHQRSAEGSQTFYVGHSSRSGLSANKNLSTSGSKTKKKRGSYEKLKPNQKSSYQEMNRGYKQRESRGKQSSGAYSSKAKKQEDRGFSNKTEFGRQQTDTDFNEGVTDMEDAIKKFPPHIEERIVTIRKRMSRPEIFSGTEKGSRKQHSHGKSHKEGYERNTKSYGKDQFRDIMDDIDFRKHLGHIHDHGQTMKSGYEKFVNEHGSEIWVKTEENYSELHHM